MCDKAFDKSFLAFIYILDWYKAQEICDSIICEDSFSIRYFSDQYKTEKCVMKLLIIV